MDLGLIITLLAFAVIIAAAFFIYIKPVREAVEEKTGKEDYLVLLELTETAVRWARQWMQTNTGEEKKERVLRYLRKKIQALGLDTDEEDIDKAIEGVYDKIKHEANQKKTGNEETSLVTE